MRAMASAPQLAFADVELRPWRDSDVHEIVACCSDALVAWWLDSIPQPYRVEHARAYVAQAREAWRTGASASFAVVDSRSGAVLGSISVRWVDRGAGVAEAGYWIRREARGRGVATRALALAAAYALDELRADRVQVRAELRNEASQRVAEKAGFTREGVLRSAGWSARQQRRMDWVMYSLVPSDPRPRG